MSSTDGEPTRPKGSGPAWASIFIIFALIALLMTFSVCAILLSQVTLAVTAGSAAVALVVEVVRRVLHTTDQGPPKPPPLKIDADRAD